MYGALGINFYFYFFGGKNKINRKHASSSLTKILSFAHTIAYNRLYNRFNNRLYRVNGALSIVRRRRKRDQKSGLWCRCRAQLLALSYFSTARFRYSANPIRTL